MDIHKPKPIHGWRDFIKEVGIIVLGVSIALTGEQMVENWREHRQYLAARQAVRTELGLQLNNLRRRDTFKACVAQRLEEVGALLDRAEAHQPFTPPTWIGRPLASIIRTASEADVSRSNLFPPGEQSIYSLAYAWLHATGQYQDQEQMAWSHLLPLEGRASLTPEMIADMRAAIGEARMASDRIRINMGWLNLFARRYGIPTDVTSEWSRMRPPVWAVCMPMSTPRIEGERMMFEYVETHK